ncbi:CoA-binding protein [Gordonia sp. (in: high G+C Gram-positive bacteria)]|uniref:CoA-binding protein n=1 Tax=Gordonia sp. (in: high G+C Gram-positive bacteria) TaxID=84139 RepID=UPI0039E35A43
MTDRAETDAVVEEILRSYDTITVVGASANPAKAANEVPAYMREHGWRIIPVNPHADEIVGEKVYRSLSDIPEPIGLVDVFRPSADCAAVARDAAAAGATALWLQLGITSPEARQIAADAGMAYVEDRCLIIEQRRTGITARR